MPSPAQRKSATPSPTVSPAGPRRLEPSKTVEPETQTTTPVFGDPDWIERRGKVRVPKLRIRVRAKKKRKRYFPIWQRIEGEWTPYRCLACSSVSFVVIGDDGIFVEVRCAAGHNGKVLAGFAMTRPEE